jgi:hypothetical protein
MDGCNYQQLIDGWMGMSAFFSFEGGEHFFGPFFVFSSFNKKRILEMNKAKETMKEKGLFSLLILSKWLIISSNVIMSPKHLKLIVLFS